MNYHEGRIEEYGDGFAASYLCRRVGKPYQAVAGRGLATIEEAKTAIDKAVGAQAEYLSRVDAVTYEQVRTLDRGATWYKPSFWGSRDEVLRVVYVGERYILSIDQSNSVYLSAGNADCEFAFTAQGDIFAEAKAWTERFESQPAEVSDTCHYCGQPATGTGFFGEAACAECGG